MRRSLTLTMWVGILIYILTLWRKNTNFVKKSDFTYSILCKEYDYVITHNLQLLKFSHGP